MISSSTPFRFLCLVYFVICSPLQISGQNVARSNFKPHVISINRSEPVLFEALVTGAPTKVMFEYNGLERPMNDDGSNGDVVAGDSIYTIIFQAGEITGKLTDSDVFRPFIGFCIPYQGEIQAGRFNIFAEIWTEEIQLVSFETPDTNVQVSQNIFNIKGQIPLGGLDPRLWTNKFYEYFDDDYDFFNLIILPSLRGNRYHITIKNTTTGIGLTQFDGTNYYGSSGKLIGITVFPISMFFDGAEKGYQHELGHQWINFLHGTPFDIGIPHWPLSDVASGIMGKSIPGSNVGGSFPYQLIPEGDNYRTESLPGEPLFNDLELYLMGLLEPDSVTSHFIFEDQNQTPQGNLLLGPVTHITISELISVLGPRDPDYLSSQKTFRIATIIISDELLSPEAMSFFNFFARRAELREQVPFASGFLKSTANPFFLSTGGRGELETHIGDLPSLVNQSSLSYPNNFFLSQNYPNPFNSETQIKFQLSTTADIALKIFNPLGCEIRELINRKKDAGSYSLIWDGKNNSGNYVGSGIYLILFECNESQTVKKMILIR